MKSRYLVGIAIAAAFALYVGAVIQFVRSQSDYYCPPPSAASVATLFAPCQAFESAMGHRVSKQEAVQMGLLAPDQRPEPATQLADPGIVVQKAGKRHAHDRPALLSPRPERSPAAFLESAKAPANPPLRWRGLAGTYSPQKPDSPAAFLSPPRGPIQLPPLAIQRTDRTGLCGEGRQRLNLEHPSWSREIRAS